MSIGNRYINPFDNSSYGIYGQYTIDSNSSGAAMQQMQAQKEYAAAQALYKENRFLSEEVIKLRQEVAMLQELIAGNILDEGA